MTAEEFNQADKTFVEQIVGAPKHDWQYEMEQLQRQIEQLQDQLAVERKAALDAFHRCIAAEEQLAAEREKRETKPHEIVRSIRDEWDKREPAQASEVNPLDGG